MNPNEIPYSTLFIELDVLLDTRVAVLAAMGPDAVANAFASNYLDRYIDEFPNVDNVKFKEIYEHRTKAILKNTTITNISNMLKEFAENTLTNVINGPNHFKPRIILNVYPYSLTTAEEIVLVKAIRVITHDLASIDIVNMSYEDITPSYLKREVAILILYEYYKWLEINCDNGALKKVTCPDVTLFGPAILFKQLDSPIKDNENPYKDMELMARPFIGLKLLPISHFSLKITPTEETKEEEQT